jgi:hypothetical protein
MGDEYAAFHYLGHKTPEHQKAFLVTVKKPLSFDELYSPRDSNNEPILIGTKEKSFWRTRDSIAFNFYECRAKKVLIITCKDMASKNKDALKTILINLEILYKIFETKKKNTNENDNDDNDNEIESNNIQFKSQKIIQDDETLWKATIDFLEKRLFITAELIEWPSFNESLYMAEQEKSKLINDSEIEDKSGIIVDSINSNDVIKNNVEFDSEDLSNQIKPILGERMVVLTMLHDDKDKIELPIELLSILEVDISNIDSNELKLVSTESLTKVTLPIIQHVDNETITNLNEIKDEINEIDDKTLPIVNKIKPSGDVASTPVVKIKPASANKTKTNTSGDKRKVTPSKNK